MNQLWTQDQEQQQQLYYEQQQRQNNQQQRQNNFQQSVDPWQNYVDNYKQRNNFVDTQINNPYKNNNKIKIIEVRNIQQKHINTNSPQQNIYGQNPQVYTPQTQGPITFNQNQPQKPLSAYDQVFKTIDGPNNQKIVYCNYEDVKRYMESETRQNITPSGKTGVRKIIEISHKMD